MSDNNRVDRHPEAVLPDYTRGMLTGHEKERVEEHLSRCDACRERVSQLRALFVRLDAARPTEPPPSYFASIVPRVRERIERRVGERWAPDPVLARFAAPAAAAVLAVLVLLRLPLPDVNGGDSNSTLASALRGHSVPELYDVVDDEGMLLIGLSESRTAAAETVPEMLISRALTDELAEAVVLGSSPLLGETAETLIDDLSDAEADRLIALLSERIL